MTTLLTDSFTRTNVSSGWGTATDSHVWSHPVGTGAISVASNEGLVTTTPGAYEHMVLGTVISANEEILVRCAPSGLNDTFGAILRYAATSKGYLCCYDGNASPGNIYIYSDNAGLTTLVTAAFTVVANSFYWIRANATGTSIKMRIWLDGSSEPSAWNLTATSSTYTTGEMGLVANSNNVNVKFDNFAATDGATATTSSQIVTDAFAGSEQLTTVPQSQITDSTVQSEQLTSQVSATVTDIAAQSETASTLIIATVVTINPTTEQVTAFSNLSGSQTVTTINPTTEQVTDTIAVTLVETSSASETTLQTNHVQISSSNPTTEQIIAFAISTQSVSTINPTTENILTQVLQNTIEAAKQSEVIAVAMIASFAEAASTSEAVKSLAIQLASSLNPTSETVSVVSIISYGEGTNQSEVASVQTNTTLPETANTSETVASGIGAVVSSSNPAAQMLYDDVQIQYGVLLASTVAPRIKLVALTYYTSKSILHSVPGEIDVILTSENITQMHILRTINDVNAFILAYT